MSPLRAAWVGIRRHGLSLFAWFLEFFGAIWLVIEATSFFSAWVRQYTESNTRLLLAALVVAACAALWRARAPVAVVLPLRHSNTQVEVRFGDLFAIRGDHLAIPVNDGFDGALGDTVDRKSVHGQFVQKFYRGSQREFEAACDARLSKAEGVPSGRKGRRLAYVIGTTAALPLEGRKAFLFALSKTDAQTLKASADVPIMWRALDGLWKCVRIHSNGHAVSLPLVGAGQSGVGIEPKHLLRLILLSILVATREGEVCKRISVVLHPDMFEKIDLRAVENDWS
ncbi:MAG: DUF6430 domain-containing protein [Hyphomicrobium sp.]|uniref:macro domain-containing protein n=1 Tax=Hyphomicrobium sp. TaxID=82 RepID=UPI00132517CB|nr:macro domain-containing protein [Hyphomicrobium sp.]KAB2940914.1 MAG: hypothetical protein F9K20_11315 [Hyphomicrobium sp.]MBZ0211387.1 DUF6430 domain-containing protein [Hyphomicrobium sp.]